MKTSDDQALIGTEAIKAFASNFGPMNDIVNRIVLEELIKFLVDYKEINERRNI